MEVVQPQEMLSENAQKVPVICLVGTERHAKKVSNMKNWSEQKTPRDFFLS